MRRIGVAAAALVWAALVGAQTPGALAQGEIRKIDEAAAKITIRHGDIPSIGMPPMTMVFMVKDLTLLQNKQPGDKIHFDVIQEGGKLVVTRIEIDK